MRHGAAAALLLAIALLVAAGSGEAGAPPPVTGWLTFGGGAARLGRTAEALAPAKLRPAWYRATDGVDTTQPLVVHNVPAAGQTTVYVATNGGHLIAYAPNGYIRWQRNLGVAPNPCVQLQSYGITGTPVVDAATRAIYAVDALGLMHSLDLATGVERHGWPVVVYDDPTTELDWGALQDVKGSIYLGTGSFCDGPMVGKLVRVEIASRHVSTLTVVPKSLGGGGSIWGWGGMAYSAARDAFFAVTGNAFEGGTNTGPSFSEAAGYGEQLIEVTRDLRVVAANHPESVAPSNDDDFAGSPVVFTRSGCAETVAAVNKNGRLFLWHTDAVQAGPYSDLVVQPASVDQPLLSQPVFDTGSQSVFVVTSAALVKVAVDGCDSAHVAWTRAMPLVTLHGSPTVAGNVVWLGAVGGAKSTLRGYDTRSGELLYSSPLGVAAFAPPSIVGGRLFEGSEHGFAVAGAQPSRPQKNASALRAYTSWSDKRHGWRSREAGVFSTSDGGKTWHRIYRTYAERVLQLSPSRGVISVGAPGRCECAQEQLYTSDGAKTWHVTRALFRSFSGTGRAVYTWSGNTIRRAAWPPVASTPVVTFMHTIADLAAVPTGIAVLLTGAGQSWDNEARLAIVRGRQVQPVALPAEPGRVLVRAITVRWPSIVVRGYLFTDAGRRTLHWQSADGGDTWRVD